MKAHLALSVAAFCLSAPAAFAHDTSGVALNKIHHINQVEIQLSNLALQKSETPEVKSFAQHMIDQHTDADKKVQALAAAEGYTLAPIQLADFEQVGTDHLKELSGRPFDIAYVSAIKMGHKEAIFDLDETKDETKDDKLKDLVKEIRPNVKDHEKMASKLQDKLKG